MNDKNKCQTRYKTYLEIQKYLEDGDCFAIRKMHNQKLIDLNATGDKEDDKDTLLHHISFFYEPTKFRKRAMQLLIFAGANFGIQFQDATEVIKRVVIDDDGIFMKQLLQAGLLDNSTKKELTEIKLLLAQKNFHACLHTIDLAENYQA